MQILRLCLEICLQYINNDWAKELMVRVRHKKQHGIFLNHIIFCNFGVLDCEESW